MDHKQHPFDTDYSLYLPIPLCNHTALDRWGGYADLVHRLASRRLTININDREVSTWLKTVISPKAWWTFTLAVEFVTRGKVLTFKCRK